MTPNGVLASVPLANRCTYVQPSSRVKVTVTCIWLARLDSRRTRSDLIETYKISNEVYDIPKDIFLTVFLRHVMVRCTGRILPTVSNFSGNEDWKTKKL